MDRLSLRYGRFCTRNESAPAVVLPATLLYISYEIWQAALDLAA